MSEKCKHISDLMFWMEYNLDRLADTVATNSFLKRYTEQRATREAREYLYHIHEHLSYLEGAGQVGERVISSEMATELRKYLSQLGYVIVDVDKDGRQGKVLSVKYKVREYMLEQLAECTRAEEL